MCNNYLTIMAKKEKVLYVDMDNVLVDFQSGFDALAPEDKEAYMGTYDNCPHIFSKMVPIKGAIESFKRLSADYDTYILSTSPWDNPTALNDKLEWVSRTDDSLGYDIRSYNVDEKREMYIEVKTTTGSSTTPFYISENEIDKSRELKDKYYIYRLYKMDRHNP